MVEWRNGLAPGHTRDTEGNLRVGGVDVRQLADRYGTPLLAIDFDVFDAAIAQFAEACATHDVEVAYAGKALLLTAIAKHLVPTAIGIDVCSIGELVTAERAGFPAGRLTLHGCGKYDEELDAAVTGRVGTIVTDSRDELQRLAARVPDGRRLKVVVRVNAGIEAHTHDFVRTSGEDSKFGIPAGEIDGAIADLRSLPQLEFTGLHSHIGSQVYDADAFVANVRSLGTIMKTFATAGLETKRLIVGGGFGVQMHPHGERIASIQAVVGDIATTLRDVVRELGVPQPHLGIEPGRSLIGHAGTSIYRVMARKQQSTRTFVVVDGSLADNPRPALYDAQHHVVAARRSDQQTRVTMCGRCCESDVLAETALPAGLAAGDLVAMCTTGAYTYSMASNYNRFAKPAVVALQGGTSRLIAQRQTIEDVLKNDCDA